MVITLFVFLIIYFIFAGIILLFYLVNFYHIVRFGALNFVTVFVSFIFLCGIIILAYFSYQYIIQVNWQEPVINLENLPFLKLKIELPGSSFNF